MLLLERSIRMSVSHCCTFTALHDTLLPKLVSRQVGVELVGFYHRQEFR